MTGVFACKFTSDITVQRWTTLQRKEGAECSGPLSGPRVSPASNLFLVTTAYFFPVCSRHLAANAACTKSTPIPAPDPSARLQH